TASWIRCSPRGSPPSCASARSVPVRPPRKHGSRPAPATPRRSTGPPRGTRSGSSRSSRRPSGRGDPPGRLDAATMPEVSLPVHEPEVHWDVRVPVRAGLALSANLWLPRPLTGAPDEPFPVILEMIPYGKDNWRLTADTARGEWLAARGFALCRLDVRGTGSSPGVAIDEYTEAETLD